MEFKITTFSENGNFGWQCAMTFPTLENAMKATELFTEKNWEIRRYNSDPVEEERMLQSPSYIEILNRYNEERAKEIKDKTDKARRINELPTRYAFNAIALPSEVVFFWTRDEARYNPTNSSRVIYNLSLNLVVDGVAKNFWFYEYQTRDGKLLKKKFSDDMFRMIGPYRHLVDTDLLLASLNSEDRFIRQSIKSA